MGVCLSDWCITVHGNTTKHEMSNGCLSNWCITVHGNTTKHEMSNGCLSDWCIAVHGNTAKHDSSQVSKVLQFYISFFFTRALAQW